jgi:hypothetical protein
VTRPSGPRRASGALGRSPAARALKATARVVWAMLGFALTVVRFAIGMAAVMTLGFSAGRRRRYDER